jgi:UDPglucose 6-dehydrogenase
VEPKPQVISAEGLGMDVSVVGSGYVGTTLSACLADLGHEVTAIDIDEETVDRLNEGETTIHEPGLDPLVSAYAGSRLRATTAHAAAAETDITFLAVGTPANPDGSIDAAGLLAAAGDLGEAIAGKEEYHLVVVKSTVLPDVIAEELIPTIEAAAGKTDGEGIGIAVNPEFLREGSAVDDFMDPDKIVLGTDGDDRALDSLAELYQPLITEWEIPVVETGRREAAMIKYANNTFLATKISLINDLGNVCKEFDVDAYEVADAIGLDSRIGGKFLRSGVGWGGSCFPKDSKALAAAAESVEYEPLMIDAAIELNDVQPVRLLELLDDHADVDGERIAVLGLAFKPGTDDIRGTRAKPVIEGLLDRGAEVVAYDPLAADAMAEEYPGIEYADSAAAALNGASGAAVVTDWPAFAELDTEFDAMADPVVVDGRRIIERREGIVYEGLTW